MTQSEVKTLALELMRNNNANRNLIAEGWKFAFMKTKRTIGLCEYPNRTRTGTIYYSLHWLSQSDADIRDTILHEMAHAVAGPKTGHGHVWKMWAIKLGARPERCGQASDETKQHLASIAKYVAKCPGCNHVIYAHKRKKHSSSCSKCSGRRYNEKFKFVWEANRGQYAKPTTAPTKQPTHTPVVPFETVTTPQAANAVKVGSRLMVRGVVYEVVEFESRNYKNPVIIVAVGHTKRYKTSLEIAKRHLLPETKVA